MKDHRGRPKMLTAEDMAPKIKYEVSYKEDDGCVSVWKYDWEINKISGLVQTETIYPEGYVDPQIEIEKANKKLPLFKQKFFNPSNGKMVGYARAKSLKLI
jgi:hypothetical protein